jgi:hypothetical protein
LTCCHCTKVSKSRVCKANNYSRHGGFLALLLLWSVVLQILSFTIRRVGVDEIEKERLGGERIACNDIKKVFEKDNPTRIDRDKDG